MMILSYSAYYVIVYSNIVQSVIIISIDDGLAEFCILCSCTQFKLRH